MEKQYEMLMGMRGRWDVYMSVVTLRGLRNYLSGYDHALVIHGIKEETLADCRKKGKSFHDFVARKLKFGESTAGYANMILYIIFGLNPKRAAWGTFDKMCESTTEEQHQESIDKFYTLLDEFLGY